MKRRSQAVKKTEVLHSGTVFTSRQEFESGLLTTKKSVIERTLHEDNFLKKSAAAKIAKELIELWNWCNVYTKHYKTVAETIFEMMNNFSKLCRYPKKKRKDQSYTSKEADFLEDIDCLFDIVCQDESRRRALEKKHGVKMTEKEFSFYKDQKSTRKQKCIPVVEPLTDADVKFQKRYGSELQLYDSPVPSNGDGNLASISTTTFECDSIASHSSTSSECSSSEDSTTFVPVPQDTKPSQNRKRWPKLAQMCERYLISD